MLKKSPLLSSLGTEYNNMSHFYLPAMASGILVTLTGWKLSWSLACSLGILLVILALIKQFRQLHPLFWLLAFFIFGMVRTDFRIHSVETPTLSSPLYHADIQGRVIESSALSGKQRITLDTVHFLNQPLVKQPKRLMLTYEANTPPLTVGSIIKAQAYLRPLRRPTFPHAYDEKQQLYFKQIGGIGTIEKIISYHNHIHSWITQLEQTRAYIAHRIQQIIPDETAQIAIPLTIGEQKVVSPHLYDIFRAAGIIHILSVSGFHLSLLAAFVFFFIRKILSLWPAFAERLSTKKVASVIALLCTGGYILLSGMQVPTIRSFIMIAIVLIAILFNRNALSVRSWSIAAFILLAYRPEFILNISFQLSFMAVLVLVTLYPYLYKMIWPKKPRSLFYRILSVFAGFLLVDFLMTLTTTPYVIYHFNRYALFSCLGNVLTGALLAFWIMPLLFIGMIMMPIGCDSIFFQGAAVGLEYVIAVCEKIKNLPHALVIFPSFSPTALIVMTAGLMLLCLMRTRWRFTGLVIMVIGIMLTCLTPRPDILIGDKGNTVAVRKDGKLFFLKHAPNDFTARSWLLHNGEDPDLPIKTIETSELVIKGKKIAFHPLSCINADLCLLAEPYPKQPQAIPLYTPDIRAIYIRNNRIQIKNP